MSRKRKIPVSDDYYSRQVIMKELGKQGQKKLANSKVAIVGLGGLGTISSLYLTLAGVGSLRLIDQDTIELQNLHRQVLYSADDLHFPKVEVAARNLEKTNSRVKIEPVPENLNAQNVEDLISGFDCVVDGLDNMSTRYLVNRACADLGVSYVFGAAIGIEGNLSIFEPTTTPCLECVLPAVRDERLLTCETRGVLGATAGIIGTMQAMETIKLLAGIGCSLKGKFMICDFSDMTFTTIDIFRRKNCPVCGEGTGSKETGEKLMWLCGKNTVNINPELPMTRSLDEVYESIKNDLKVRIKSRLALVFEFRGHEITLFNGGRMLIRNVLDEKRALHVYEQLREKLQRI